MKLNSKNREGRPQHTPARLRVRVAISGVLVACAGCTTSDAGSAQAPDANPPEPGMLDEQGIERTAASYEGTFIRVNKHSYPTRQHLGNMPVDVYANAEAETVYRTIDYPATAAKMERFPAGAMLVKAMLQDGAPAVLTVMYKRSPGYDPTHGDWWYGRLSPDGTPTNAAYVGKVDFCVSCHSGAAATDYAWGIEPSNK